MEEIRGNTSQLHKDALRVVKELFPHHNISNEFPIKIGNNTLYLDIYIKELKIAVETDGEQHQKFNKFFHGDAAGFARAKRNDAMKEEFCKNNNIALVRLTKKEIDKDTLLKKIRLALKERVDERDD